MRVSEWLKAQTRKSLQKLTKLKLKMKKFLSTHFFKAQFNFNPLVWTLHSRKLNNRINRLHRRCLRIIYDSKLSCY